jgi:hypothetical protein
VIPRKLTDATRSMGKPSDWDDSLGECQSLDIHDTVDEKDNPIMISAWALEEGELEKLAAGAPLFLRIYGTGHPVVALYAGDPEKKAN